MACTGPVAYQWVHSGRISSVISRGALQVAPWSSLTCRYGSRPPLPVPGLWVVNSRTRPVRSSTIGIGLPCVSPLPRDTTCNGPQVRPPSWDRFSTRSMLPRSSQLLIRPSANASRSPLPAFTIAGIRKQKYPSVFAV